MTTSIIPVIAGLKVLYTIYFREGVTRSRGADSGKSNHTCSIQLALDTRVPTETYDVRKTGTENVVSGVGAATGGLSSNFCMNKHLRFLQVSGHPCVQLAASP